LLALNDDLGDLCL
jgi:hypothetical protein